MTIISKLFWMVLGGLTTQVFIWGRDRIQQRQSKSQAAKEDVQKAKKRVKFNFQLYVANEISGKVEPEQVYHFDTKVFVSNYSSENIYNVTITHLVDGKWSSKKSRAVLRPEETETWHQVADIPRTDEINTARLARGQLEESFENSHIRLEYETEKGNLVVEERLPK